ncbi:hypothetical protein [Mesomycoplasma ovipneumoniae]|uniref:hypothetical protein n=1 Tax=Mesomycoplasma ovipneumoniae TaxID=29562 RepID=UPI00311ACAF1
MLHGTPTVRSTINFGLIKVIVEFSFASKAGSSSLWILWTLLDSRSKSSSVSSEAISIGALISLLIFVLSKSKLIVFSLTSWRFPILTSGLEFV